MNRDTQFPPLTALHRPMSVEQLKDRLDRLNVVDRVYLDPPLEPWERITWAVILTVAAALLATGLFAWVSGQ